MIKITKLEINNFRSCEEYSINLSDMGLTLICGPNGVGKSTIRTAIEYLLTDTTADDIPLDEFTRFNQGNCRLYIQLERDGKDTIEITKYREDSKYGNSTILLLNGKDLSRTDRRETQKEITKLLGLSSYTLFSTSIFSSSSPSFVSSKESERKDFLYEVQDISKYDTYLDKAKEKCNVCENNINNCKSEIVLNKAKLRDIEDSLSKTDLEINRYTETKNAKLSKLKEELNSLVFKDTSECEYKISSLKHSLVEYDVVDQKVKLAEKAITEREKQLARLSYEKSRISKDITALDNCNCPLLNIDCTMLRTGREGDKSKLLCELTDVLEQEKKVFKDINECKNRLKDYEKTLNDKKLIANILEREEEELSNIKAYNKSIEMKKDFITRTIKEEETATNPYINIKEDLLTKREGINKLLEKIEKNLTFHEECLPYYIFWKTGFSKKGIPNMKCEGFLSALQYETNKILSDLNSKYVVNISATTTLKSKDQREKISYKILREDGKDYSYASFSGGEKQRIKLADMWAMHKLCSPLDLVILDECLELSLDEAGKGEVMEMLKQLATTISSVIVISHDTEIKDKFERVIRFG